MDSKNEVSGVAELEPNTWDEDVAKKCLGEYYNPLKEFYRSIFNTTRYDYIVFIVRRSLTLAEIFFNILQEEECAKIVKGAQSSSLSTSEKVKSGYEKDLIRMRYKMIQEKFCTDSFIITKSEEFAQDFINNEIPQILIVDEMVIQGNVLNELIMKLEDSVLYFLFTRNPEDDKEYLKNTIRKKLISTIDLRVFSRNQKILLLNPSYQVNFKAERIMEPKEWHRFSYCVSDLLDSSNIINASFIMGARIKSLQHEFICSDFHAIEYKNKLSKRLVYFLKQQEKSNRKYIATIRMNYCKNEKYAKIIPFVFMPRLSVSGYDYLLEEIRRSWMAHTELTQIQKDSVDIMFRSYHGFGTEYELISLFLSTSLLHIFCSEYYGEGYDYESLEFNDFKIMANFGWNQIPLAVNEVNFVLLKNLKRKNCLFSKEKFLQVLEFATKDASDLYIEESFEDTQKGYVDNKSDFVRNCEDLICGLKTDELTRSFRIQNGLEKHDFKNYNIPLMEFINEKCKKVIGRYQVGISELIVVLLQFMDKGYITLKVKQIQGDTYFEHKLRMGERSLFIWAERYRHFLPVLDLMQGNEWKSTESIYDTIDRFIELEKQKGGIPEELLHFDLAEGLVRFVKSIEYSGQTINEWNIDFNKNHYVKMNEKINTRLFSQDFLLKNKLLQDYFSMDW